MDELISRQAALDLCERFNGCVPYSVLSSHDYLPSVSTEKKEPCEDAISIDNVIEWLKNKDIIKLSTQEKIARNDN